MEQLAGTVQPYAWGDRAAIATMQGRPPTGEPEAELWLGAHPKAPSQLVSTGRSLVDHLAADPGRMLGPDVEARFGGFPYLLKILAAAEPLSIQAHPSLAQAEAGFAREDEARLAWDAPTRTYRDANHKPELICALTRFEAKCGFRPLEATKALIAGLTRSSPGPGLGELAHRLDIGAGGDPSSTLASVMAWLLRLPAGEAAALTTESVEAAERLVSPGRFEPELQWTAELNRRHPSDIGVVVALLLNHVILEPGEALFLEAGNLHAYLRGTGVELMANSDNVVRGGLTVKHVDVEELLQVMTTCPAPPPVQRAHGGEHRFHAPVADFALTRLGGGLERSFEPAGPEIILVTDGAATLIGNGSTIDLGPGEAAFVAHDDGAYRLLSEDEAVVWRATVGDLAL